MKTNGLTRFSITIIATCAIINWASWEASAQVELSVRMTPRITTEGGPGLQVFERSESLGNGAKWIAVTNVFLPFGGRFDVYDTNSWAGGQRYYRTATKNLPGLIWISRGKFILGSNTNEAGRSADEGPVTEVTLSQGFWMGQYEVTQGEYRSVMGQNPSWFTGDDQLPVEMVSWQDATNYCRKLTDLEIAAGRITADQEYRLPTEAQWEYACRAGGTNRFSFGDDLQGLDLGGYAWYVDNSELQTHPAGKNQPNAWGLYDMYGNVWEWCLDRYGAYPGGAVIDPQGPISGNNRVKRGGAWNSELVDCRSARRLPVGVDVRQISTGFRVVLVSLSNSASVPSINKLAIDLIPQVTLKGEAGVYNVGRMEIINDAPQWTIIRSVMLSSNDVSDFSFYDTNLWRGGQRFYRAALMAGTNWVWIKPGTFTMGSPSTEQDRESDEGPQTVVTLTKGYWMSKYETTQAEYQLVMGSNPSYFTGDTKRPVEQVSWNDAANYCGKLTVRERAAGRLPAVYEYRLPTEAEWEYACRAGTTTRFSYGDDSGYSQLGQYAWYYNNSSSSSHAVGSKQPNAWGLYDMHGNVYEWCLDWFGTYPGGSVTNPKGANTGSYRVYRGGSWLNFGRYCRSADRNGFAPGDRDGGLGFRPVLVQVP